MTISFYKGLTRNPEFWNTSVWVFLNIWRLGQVRDIKFGSSVSDKMLLNAAKYQQMVEGGGSNYPSSPQIRVKLSL